ncbi:major facilitator superfamily domain-containing protein [Aspergillus minisclerotigenes]|uniref:Major facilitator superfamily domain-containing protein n=1 Tax=Aspergillus minisclerotigenes TaxID=656917 RepID=A0A5N6JBI1_9EURO|nr:major facilitator superfamily domain-containing protein [Aspergillus minisclerotigenes]
MFGLAGWDAWTQKTILDSEAYLLPSESPAKTSTGGDNEAAKDPTEKPAAIDPALVRGVTVSRPEEGDGSTVYLVGWRDNGPSNPQVWSLPWKWIAMITCCCLGIALTIPTSVEGPAQEAFQDHFGVSPMAGSMSTGIFLIGVGVGSLFSGPFSETFGRNIVYFVSMVVVMLFIMAKALAPSYGVALAFRFFGALFDATPMTVAGGTIGDIWKPMHIPFGLPLIGLESADWISMIIIGAVLVFVLIAQLETYSPLLLEWRARHLRELTGDDRYQAEHTSASSLGFRLLANVYRPFFMVWTEPIILVFSFYLVLLYFVLFTFLNGISASLTFIIWVAKMPEVAVAIIMVPYIYSLTKKAAASAMTAGKPLQPEVSLYWAMAGASILMPVSLFWMARTCYSDISIWSPIIASAIFGYALVCIFTTIYMYIIFVYLQHSASALGFMTFARYVISGALSPASIKMYENIGTHWSLIIVGIIATVMAPVPYVLYKYGHKVRAMSRNVQNRA